MEKLTDKSPMPFGRYKGQKMSSLPADYLLAMGSHSRDALAIIAPEVLAYIDASAEDLRESLLVAQAEEHKDA